MSDTQGFLYREVFMNAYRKGVFYEWRAAWKVRCMGMHIIARRYRARGGEIDLIAKDHGTIVFIEVKARPESGKGTGIEAVGYDKVRRVRAAAEAWMQKKHCLDADCRFDIVEYTKAGCYYVKNAF